MNWPRLLVRLLGRRLPVLDGKVVVEGLGVEVTIRRDRFGVPHIDSPTAAGAWFGLGFCQGQDRAFQLEARVRLVRGTLAALFGPDLLPIDRLARRIGFARYGERCLDLQPEPDRADFDTFAAGVRAGMGAGGGGRSHEFTLLRTTPTPFRAADSLGFLAVLGFALASNWDVELARLRMLALDGPEAVRDLHPAYPAAHPVSATPGRGAARVVDALAEDLSVAASWYTGGGSNNWAIAGSRTSSGRPILANDPHLAPVLPPHWYLARLSTPEWSLTGASVPGTPLFAAGHNEHGAWGVTAGLIDNTDLFLEEIGPDGATVRRGDDLVPCTVRRETIEVKGGHPELIDVMETDRGPIVGPAFEGELGALSMSATWLRPAPLSAALRLGELRSFDDIEQAFADWPSVPLNVAYADGAGIAWMMIGEAPQRSGGGTIPLPASDPATRWSEEHIASARLPRLRDPDTGYVATANNLPSTEIYLGSDFLDGYRVGRINELLAGRDDWSVEAALQMQLDQYSVPWREMRDVVLAAATGDGTLAPIADLLRQWDGRVSADSTAASVFEVFVARMAAAIAEARAPRSSHYALGAGFTPLVPFTTLTVRRVSHLIALLHSRPEGWFADGWDDAVRSALHAARDLLSEQHGPDPGAWGWGSVRQLRLRHPLGMRTPLDRIYDLGPMAVGGDANTINPSPVDPRDPLANPDFAIASLRFVVEVGDWGRARYAIPGGQSGNPFSDHYADQVPLWTRGDGLTIACSESETERTTRHTLALVPSGPPQGS